MGVEFELFILVLEAGDETAQTILEVCVGEGLVSSACFFVSSDRQKKPFDVFTLRDSARPIRALALPQRLTRCGARLTRA